MSLYKIFIKNANIGLFKKQYLKEDSEASSEDEEFYKKFDQQNPEKLNTSALSDVQKKQHKSLLLTKALAKYLMYRDMHYVPRGEDNKLSYSALDKTKTAFPIYTALPAIKKDLVPDFIDKDAFKSFFETGQFTQEHVDIIEKQLKTNRELAKNPGNSIPGFKFRDEFGENSDKIYPKIAPEAADNLLDSAFKHFYERTLGEIHNYEDVHEFNSQLLEAHKDHALEHAGILEAEKHHNIIKQHHNTLLQMKQMFSDVQHPNLSWNDDHKSAALKGMVSLGAAGHNAESIKTALIKGTHKYLTQWAAHNNNPSEVDEPDFENSLFDHLEQHHQNYKPEHHWSYDDTVDTLKGHILNLYDELRKHNTLEKTDGTANFKLAHDVSPDYYMHEMRNYIGHLHGFGYDPSAIKTALTGSVNSYINKYKNPKDKYSSLPSTQLDFSDHISDEINRHIREFHGSKYADDLPYNLNAIMHKAKSYHDSLYHSVYEMGQQEHGEAVKNFAKHLIGVGYPHSVVEDALDEVHESYKIPTSEKGNPLETQPTTIEDFKNKLEDKKSYLFNNVAPNFVTGRQVVAPEIKNALSHRGIQYVINPTTGMLHYFDPERTFNQGVPIEAYVHINTGKIYPIHPTQANEDINIYTPEMHRVNLFAIENDLHVNAQSAVSPKIKKALEKKKLDYIVHPETGRLHYFDPKSKTKLGDPIKAYVHLDTRDIHPINPDIPDNDIDFNSPRLKEIPLYTETATTPKVNLVKGIQFDPEKLADHLAKTYIKHNFEATYPNLDAEYNKIKQDTLTRLKNNKHLHPEIEEHFNDIIISLQENLFQPSEPFERPVEDSNDGYKMVPAKTAPRWNEHVKLLKSITFPKSMVEQTATTVDNSKKIVRAAAEKVQAPLYELNIEDPTKPDFASMQDISRIRKSAMTQILEHQHHMNSLKTFMFHPDRLAELKNMGVEYKLED